MKVVILEALCAGNGDCVEIAPELFELQEDGLARVLIDTPDESMREKVISAVRRCPEGAISIVD